MIKNILSVSSIAAIGLLVWIFDYILFKHEVFIAMDLTGMLFALYNATFIEIHSLLSTFEDTTQSGVMRGIYYIWLCFLPSTFIWLGIQMKGNGTRLFSR
jgi:hypothetical protein